MLLPNPAINSLISNGVSHGSSPLSYFLRLSGSDNTAYAFEISLNFSSASNLLLGFLSG